VDAVAPSKTASKQLNEKGNVTEDGYPSNIEKSIIEGKTWENVGGGWGRRKVKEVEKRGKGKELWRAAIKGKKRQKRRKGEEVTDQVLKRGGVVSKGSIWTGGRNYRRQKIT